LLRLVRVRGLRRTVRAVVQAYLFAFRRWYILTRIIPAEPPRAPNAEFEYRLATLADLESLAVFEPNRKRREFRAWIEGGALVFVAFADGRPVSFQCMNPAVPTGPPLSSLTLAPGQIWGVDLQTLPEFRRHHVAASLRDQRDQLLLQRGYREILSSVQDDNLPALKYAYSGQDQRTDRVDRLSYLAVLGFRRIRLEKDTRPLLEQVLRQAGLLPRAP
jgi:hypothetical protein